MAEPVEKIKSHKEFAREQVTGAIGQICDAWPDAIRASAARGFGTGGSGGRQPQGDHGDPVANKVLRFDRNGDLKPDVADRWLRQARELLVYVLQFSPDDGGWTGRFDPVRMRSALKRGGAEMVDLWPMRVQRVMRDLYELADTALREWPATPSKGEKVGEVTVLERNKTGDDCAKCGKYVAGDAGDPIRRLDGKPYHMTPCWETMRKRKARS